VTWTPNALARPAGANTTSTTVKAAGLIRNLQAGGISLLGATASVAACIAATMF